MEGIVADVVFSNPEKKPLEELVLIIEEDGIKIKVPALNKRWTTIDVFKLYLPLVVSGGKHKTGCDLEEWFYESEWFLKDMKFLLSLRHFEFWSYVIYQEATMAAVVSFLKYSTPFYLNYQSFPIEERYIDLYTDILTAVVRVVCRIITNKESDEEWISKEKLKKLIYSNFLISIPMLFDLIIALGECNSKLLKKIFQTVFQIEPEYKNDLTTALLHFIGTLKSIEEQAENEGTYGDGKKPNDNLETPYDDLVLFTLDCSFTLSILLDVFPDTRQICCDIKLPQRITHFYDNTIPYLFKNIFLINEDANSLKWLNETRIQLLRAFRRIVYLHIEHVMTDPENSLMPSENFVGVMTECLADRLFVIDYQMEFPLELDVDILRQACKDLDEFKTSFVAKGYKDEADAEVFGTYGYIEKFQLDGRQNHEQTESDMPERQQPEGSAADSIDYDNDMPSTSKAVLSNISPAKQTNPDSKDRDIDLEVTNVLDVLPHLGDGFVRRVLSRYDSSEEAITAILEQNLPPDLIHSDQNEVYIPPDPQDLLYQQTGVKRYNVFDGDKYDIMTNDNPDCIIKIDKGFPNDPRNLAEMLDDKKDVNAVRHRYQEYSLVDEYEDEYDDSYEAILETESRVVKPKSLKSTLAEIEDDEDEDVEEDEEEEAEESEEEEEPSKQQTVNRKDQFDKRMNFCENPEDVRARYEAKRAAKFGQNHGKAVAPQAPRDVVGGPKGKGQAKEVVINRHKKDVNKSSRANHNRKSGAAYKRSKGMMG